MGLAAIVREKPTAPSPDGSHVSHGICPGNRVFLDISPVSVVMSGTRPPFTALVADITTLEVDAIVNAANEHLARGGGVCGAIFRAAGDGLEEACRKLAPCPTGEARVTPGLQLRARHIIHAVGPVWHGGGHDEKQLLSSAYRSALVLADEHGCQSIAFPAISTGIFGFPLEAATVIAVETVRAYLTGPTAITQVVFACFSDEVLQGYRAAGVDD